MIIQRKLISIYDYEIQGIEDVYLFRLEIHKYNNCFKGSVYRLDRYRLIPTFPQDSQGEPIGHMDDALFYVKDEFINDQDLYGESEEDVILNFTDKLNKLFETVNNEK